MDGVLCEIFGYNNNSCYLILGCKSCDEYKCIDISFFFTTCFTSFQCISFNVEDNGIWYFSFK